MNTLLKNTIVLLVLLFTVQAQALDVVELKQPNSNKVVIKVRFENGSVSDPAELAGLTYATASLMTQGGAGGMSYADIQDKIYPWAASYSANADKQVVTFTFQVPSKFIDQFYPLVKNVLLAPDFTESDFERVMKNQQNYVDQVVRASSDEDYSKFALEDLLFRGGNMQHLLQGTSASVKNIGLADIKTFYQQAFTRHNVSLGIAGNYDDTLLTKLKADLAQLSDSAFTPATPSKANQAKGIEVEIIAKDGAFGSAIFTGAPLPITRADDDFAALMIANSWMGEHRKSYSRLYQKIRQTRSMNYGDYSYIEWYDNGGRNQLPPAGVPRASNYWSIWIRPVQIAEQLKAQYQELSDINIGHAHFALRLALREFDLLIKNGMDKQEFDATKTFLRSYIKLYAQSAEQQLGWLMDSHFYGRDNYLAAMDKLLAKTTLEQVNTAIRKYWQTDNLFVTIVTDKSEAQPLADSLLNNTPSPMTYSNLVKSGLPQEVLAEDAEIARYPLNVKKVTLVPSADTFQ
ncbi:M16 family metallopeptidase [Neptunicella sp. SCSIO 80796]|uniref:M16 family metallopeptidase n=1 Tax=Neptunicella plasticusilytica TaxID=3117012 RepID=UPI003A4DB0CA